MGIPGLPLSELHAVGREIRRQRSREDPEGAARVPSLVLPPRAGRVHQASLRRGLPPAAAGADGLAPPVAPGRELDHLPDGAQGVLDDADLVLGKRSSAANPSTSRAWSPMPE